MTSACSHSRTVRPGLTRMQPRRENGEEDQAADGADDAVCMVSGPASGVYLFLWHRADAARAGVTVAGDQGLLECWQSSVRVRWG